MHKINSNTTIEGLLVDPRRSFHIPSYQRAYSWDNANKDKKNLETFLNDINEQSKTNKPYYLGHFLFEQIGNEEKYEIIDGQQRLTTTIIFISCLLKTLENRPDLPEEFDLNKEKIYYLAKGSSAKLHTVEYDDSFFQKYVINQANCNESPDTSSQRRIIGAVEYFQKQLREIETLTLLSLMEVLIKAGITTFVVEDKKQSAQIFEFQNDRGKDLTNIERLKSIFIYQIYLSSSDETADIKELEDKFREIYERTERINIHEDEVLNYYCRAFHFGYNHGNPVFETRKLMNKSADKVVWINQFCEGLRLAFKDIETLQNSEDGLLRDLIYLNNMALCYPLLLKGIRCFGAPENDNFRKLAGLLEKIVFRAKMIGSRAPIENRLNEFLMSFEGDIDAMTQSVTHKLNHDLWWVHWGDNRFKAVIEANWFYNNPVDNYLLWKYEGFLKGSGYGNIPFDTVKDEEIEHISPCTPTNGEPVANGYDSYDEEFRDKYLNCIGNLMIISKSNNCQLGNKPFSEKLKSYENNTALSQHLEIKNFLDDPYHPVWNRQSIQKRKAKIVEFALDYWKI